MLDQIESPHATLAATREMDQYFDTVEQQTYNKYTAVLMCSWDTSDFNTGYLAITLSSRVLLCGSYLPCCYCTLLMQISRITFTTF